jgi:hypothetical protein
MTAWVARIAFPVYDSNRKTKINMDSLTYIFRLG